MKVFQLFVLAAFSISSFASDQIIRLYQSPRSSALGGTRITNGVYDDNFFGNPARVTQNPDWRIQIFNLQAEINDEIPSAFNTIKGALEGDNIAQAIADTSGKNLHTRVQTNFPGVYFPGEKWSWAAALLSSSQADLMLRNSFRVAPAIYGDASLAFTLGRKLLKDDALSVGATAHFTYRIATSANFGLADIVQGKSINPLESGAQGALVDLSLGATYNLPWTLYGITFSAGLSLNHLFGGDYDMIPIRAISRLTARAPQQQRVLGVGFGAHRKELIWKLTDARIALEMSDLALFHRGTVAHMFDGSFFRLLHFGAEVKIFNFLVPRFGINQGYLGGGLGINFSFFDLDLTTYGEELSLNAGGLEDRRYALNLSFQI